MIGNKGLRLGPFILTLGLTTIGLVLILFSLSFGFGSSEFGTQLDFMLHLYTCWYENFCVHQVQVKVDNISRKHCYKRYKGQADTYIQRNIKAVFCK